jgi:hypothetical protein
MVFHFCERTVVKITRIKLVVIDVVDKIMAYMLTNVLKKTPILMQRAPS